MHRDVLPFDHWYAELPVGAHNGTTEPMHADEGPVIVAFNGEYTVSPWEAVAVHPLEFVAVTVYNPEFPALIHREDSPVFQE
jgi:hypothetical protein